MFEIQKRWRDRKAKFPAACRYHYTLSPDRAKAGEELPGFRTHPFAGRWLYTGEALDVTTLCDANGIGIGYMLGIGVGPDGLVPTHLPMDSGDPAFWDRFEAYLTDVAGRFVFFLTTGKAARLYVDPVGMIGAVFNPKERRVAAVPFLALKEPHEQNPFFDMDAIEQQGGKFSFHQTVDRHVKRLNPNHYLDLDSFHTARFWPRDEDFARPHPDPQAAYDEIHARAAFNIGAIAARHPCALPVTGGQDSRLMLSFAQTHLDKIDQVFTNINNYATRCDAAIARVLCQRIDLPHKAFNKDSFELPGWEQKLSQRIYNLAMGHHAKLPDEYANGAAKGVTEGAVILRGHQTDLLRAVFVFRPEGQWRDPDWQIKRLLLVPRKAFTPEIAARYRGAFRAWQNDLPPNAMAKAADFMFLELYYNATLGAVFPALWRNFYLSPFNSRRLITLSLRFGEDVRRKSQPVFDLIDRFSPALSDVPFDFEQSGDLVLLKDQNYCTAVTAARRDATAARLTSYAQAS